MTENNFKNFLSEHGYVLVSVYKNHYTSCVVEHSCGHQFKTQARTFKPTSCRKCFSKANTPKYTSEQYNKILEETQFILVDEYITNETQVMHQCTKCEEEFLAAPRRIEKGQKCPGCGTFKQKPSTATKTEYNGKLYPSQFEARCAKVIYEFTENVIEQKRYPQPNHMKTCDFYLPEYDLWVEVSTYNLDWYIDRINNKEKLVDNFFFANQVTTLRKFLDGLR